jgi:hypothetical protein
LVNTSASEIFLDAADLITIVVPPALPAAMTIGSLYAQVSARIFFFSIVLSFKPDSILPRTHLLPSGHDFTRPRHQGIFSKKGFAQAGATVDYLQWNTGQFLTSCIPGFEVLSPGV